ncbi:MAG TPA: hypothetical protein VGN88_08165, partial [Phycisphaerae bacterium]
MTSYLASLLAPSEAPAKPEAAESGATHDARTMLRNTSRMFVPLGDPRQRISDPAMRLLPLCSFGPGGSYIVDWQVKTPDLADPRWAHPPRTLGSIMGRILGAIMWDLKEWLVATHPRRAYRADHAPAALDSCSACGIGSLWPRWFAQGRAAPPLVFDEQALSAKA